MQDSEVTVNVAVFVTPHGFGHAARACAVIESLARRRRGVGVELVTTVPRWFFDDSLSVPYRYHEVHCDVGMVQRDALAEDAEATADRVDEYLEVEPRLVDDVVARLGSRRCRVVLTDIAPLGLVVARRLGLPSVLVENFTWDWIYRHYVDEEPRMERLAAAMSERFALADHRIQARPVCHPVHRSDATSTAVDPIARRPRRSRDATRAELDIGGDQRAVLVSMGGIPWDFGRVDDLGPPSGAVLVVPGASSTTRRIRGARLLPFRSRFFHPDLVEAVDAVVGKLGYSTVAETYRAGRPLAFLRRSRFPESAVLERFVRERLPSISIGEESFRNGSWIDRLEELVVLPSVPGASRSGADEAVAILDEVLIRRIRRG